MLKRKKILFIGYGGGHIQMLIPIIKKLMLMEQFDTLTLALTTAANIMCNNNLSYLGYKDFLKECDEDVLFLGKEIFSDNDLSAKVCHEESLAYHGVNYSDLIRHHGKTSAQKMYQKFGRQIFSPDNFMEKVLKKIQPDLLITTNSPRTERSAVWAAGRQGIPSICLIDLFALQEIQWIGKPGYATKICVLNERVKQSLCNAGRTPQEVIVTGNPAFDALFENKQLMNEGLSYKKERNWDNGLVTILYASQAEPAKHPFTDKMGDIELPRKIENELRSIIEHDTRFRLVVRYHPNENVTFKNQNRVYLSPSDENLHALLYAVDMVIVTASTVGLEAHLIGKPVISLDCSIITEDAPYSSMGISEGINNINLLKDILNSMYNKIKNNTLTLTKKRNISTSATDRIICEIKETLNLINEDDI